MVPVIPIAISMILSHMVVVANTAVTAIINHIMTRAEIPALLPVWRVMYLEVIRPVTILLYKAGELLTYNPAERIMKGVVGRTGMKIPIIPNVSEMVPADMSRSLIIFFLKNSGFQYFCRPS